MRSRIPLPSDQVTGLGIPDTSALAPPVGAALGRLFKETTRLPNLGNVTSELVRIRNARFQQCHL
jgi:hypothetical protein